jgi:lipooligosaccharide transport system permease protein
MALAVWQRNFTMYKHTWVMSLLPNFFEPFLYLLGMGVGLGVYLSEGIHGQDYVAFIGPGLVAAAAMNGASFEVTYNVFVRMNFAKLYNAYLATPASIIDIMAGEILWAVFRAVLYGAIFALILGLYSLVGYPIISSSTVWLLPFLLILIGTAFSAIGLFFTAVIKSIDLYSYYFTIFLTPLFLFSGIFYPVSRFPFGESIAWWTPLYHCVKLCRGVMQGPLTQDHLVSVIWLGALILLLFLFMPRFIRKKLLS